MAKEARRNPMSPEFSGPMPDFALGGDVNVQLVPSLAFLAEQKDLEETRKRDGLLSLPPRKPKDSDLDVLVRTRVQFIVPMRTSSQHPCAVLPVSETRLPLVEVKKNAAKTFRDAGHIGVEGLVKLDEQEA